MMDAKFHVSFYVDIHKIPDILNSVLPIGVYDFHTVFVPMNKSPGAGGPLLALPPPTNKQKKGQTKPGAPQGKAAKVIRRVLRKMPDNTATALEISRALERAGMWPYQGSTLNSLIEAGQLKKVARGTYTLVRE